MPQKWEEGRVSVLEEKLAFCYCNLVQVLQELSSGLHVASQCEDVRHQGRGVGVVHGNEGGPETE